MSENKLPSFRKLLVFPAIVLLLLTACILLNNQSFHQFTQQIFRQELSGNTLNLHYTLKDPESYGIRDYTVTLGNASLEAIKVSASLAENYKEALDRFPYKTLSRNNQLTYDILELYLQNQLSGQKFALYSEPLGSTIGIQAQLPVLLAEYAFHTREDVENYLTLLSQMEPYYSSILQYEQAKSKAGLFMSKSSARAILDQCKSFIKNPEENFLITIFSEKIQDVSFLTQVEKNTYIEKNREAVLNHVVPAYRLLIKGMTALKDTGQNQQGLCYLPSGKEYYQYLIRDSTGSYASVEKIRQRIQQQLKSDFQSLYRLVSEHPDLIARETLGSAMAFSLDNSPSTILDDSSWYARDPSQKDQVEEVLNSLSPSDILSDLKQKISKDFPSIPDVECSVKYVHESLESYLSPAFYLTPPLDDLTNNVIYINQSSTYSPLDLYTTLAHEGYPGHLYQTIYSSSVSENPIRNLFNFGGFVEGWATYVEMYSYTLTDMDANLTKLYQLNRSLTLGISSLMDLAVHYYGFTRSQVASYLGNFGFQSSSAHALYDALLEAPANYLKYYLGYLTFLDLRDAYREQQGERFSLRDFHRKVLEIGPAPFPIVAKYLLQ